MKRIDYILSTFALLAVAFFIFSIPTFAEENQPKSYEEYIEAFENLKGKFSTGTGDISADSLLSDIADAALEKWDFFLRILLCTVGTVILFALPSVLFGEGTKPEMMLAIRIGLSAVALSVLLPTAIESAKALTESANSLRELTTAASELLLGTVLASGGVKTAAAESATVALSMTAIGFIGESVLPPLLAVLAVFSVLASMDPGGLGERLSEVTVKVCYSLFGILSALFLGVLALQSAVGSAEDSLSLRAAKLAAAGWIPVIGSSVSSAMGTLIAGMKLAGSVIGSGTVALLVGLTALPLLKAVALRLALGIGSFTAKSLCPPPFSPTGIFDGISRLLGLLIAYDVFCFLICTVQSLLLLKSGVSV